MTAHFSDVMLVYNRMKTPCTQQGGWLVCGRVRSWHINHGLLVRYRKLRVVHARAMPGTFSPPPRVSEPHMHHGTCVTHVPWCMPGSLTSSFLWSRWQGRRSRHSQRMRNTQFYVSGKRTIAKELTSSIMPLSFTNEQQMDEYVSRHQSAVIGSYIHGLTSETRVRN